MSQPFPFLFAALPSSTSTNLHPSTMVPGARKLSVGSVHSSASSVYSVGSIGSIGSISGSGGGGGGGVGGGSNHSFYNLSKSCNNSNVDLNHFVHTTLPPPPAFPPASILASQTSTLPIRSPSPPPAVTHPALLPHKPVIVGSLYCNSNLSQSNLSLSRHNTCGHSLYSLGSNANSSSFSLASSQLSQFSQFSSGEKVQHAFGSMPATGVPLPPSLLSSSSSSPNISPPTSSSSSSPFLSPSHPFSASSSSLPLAASVNTPITTPATNTTKALSSASSLTSRHRSHPQPQSSQQQQQQHQNKNSKSANRHNNINNSTHSVSSSSSSDLPLTPPTRSSSSSPSSSTICAKANPPTALPQYQLRPLLLPPVATLGLLPPGAKKIQNTTTSITTTVSTPPPLNTKSLPRLPQNPSSVSINTLSPAFVSGPSPFHSKYSNSTMMTSTSPSSTGSFSPAVSSPASSAPSPITNRSSTSSHQQQSFVSLAITELVITEAQCLATIQRVAHALKKTMENTVSAGRKESATIRTLVDRWSDLTRVHAKFHDDIVAVNEDLRETASLINCMLVTLEPTLVDHGRDLTNALKKLIRRDQNSEHTFAEWYSALRQPFEHLSVYDDWMQRIDPQGNICRDYRAHLNGLIYKIKMVTEANQHPRNMLRRLSTIAKTVINKRRSSAQLLNLPPTPETPSSMDGSEYRRSHEEGTIDTPLTTGASTPVDKDGLPTFLPSPKTIQDLEIANRPSCDQRRQQPEQQQQQQQQPIHHEEQQQQQQQQQYQGYQEHQEREQEKGQIKELETVMEPVSDKAPILCPLTPLSPTFISTAIYLETTVTDFHADRPKAAGDRTSSYLSPIQTTKLHQLPTHQHQLPHRSSAASDLSSAGTLAVSPSSPSPSTSSGVMHLPTGNSCSSNNGEHGGVANSISSSSSSIRSTADTIIMVRQQNSASTLNSSSSLLRQKFLADKEARKATLRVGTSETIQARAESLQSPTGSVHSAGLSGVLTPGLTGKVGGYGAYYQARASFDNARVSPTRPVGDKESKPPVRSLISFWEQVSDPMEL